VRYTGEVHFRLSGDRRRAPAYASQARTLLGGLYERDIRRNGLGHAHKRWLLADGTTIRAIVTNPKLPPIIEIDVPPLPAAVDAALGDVVLDFVSTPRPVTSTTNSQHTWSYGSLLASAFGELKEFRGAQSYDLGHLDGPARFTTPLYVLESEAYELGVSVAPGSSPLIRTETYTVPLPGGSYTYTREVFAAGTASFYGGSFSTGDIPLDVVANTGKVYVLYASLVNTGSAFEMRANVDVLNLDGTLDRTVPQTAAFNPVLGGGAVYRLRDAVAAHDGGFYTLLRPSPIVPAYEVRRYNAIGLDWSTTTLPPGVTAPFRILAGPEGPYLVDNVANNQQRYSLLDASDGVWRAQNTFTLFDTPDPFGFVEAWQCVTQDFLYVAGSNVAAGDPLGSDDNRIHIVELDLTETVAIVEQADLVDAAGDDLEFTIGYIQPYPDSALMTDVP